MDHDTAIAAALAAAEVIRDRYGRVVHRVDKGGGDFATEADIAAEQAINKVLRSAHPADAITGEETGASGPGDARRRWLVDPLCGTLNYAVRTPLVAVNVALRDGDRVTAAATADPFTRETYWTDGAVARLRHPDGTDTPLTPSSASTLVDINLDPPFPAEPA